MKTLLTLAAFTPISFVVFIIFEDFFIGTTINILVLAALHKFFGEWLQTLKKTETCANK